jgi:hypothetical protein
LEDRKKDRARGPQRGIVIANADKPVAKLLAYRVAARSRTPGKALSWLGSGLASDHRRHRQSQALFDCKT